MGKKWKPELLILALALLLAGMGLGERGVVSADGPAEIGT